MFETANEQLWRTPTVKMSPSYVLTQSSSYQFKVDRVDVDPFVALHAKS